MKRRMLIVAGILAGIALVALAIFRTTSVSANGQVYRLADGSSLELKQSVFCATNVQFSFSADSGWIEALSPILPTSIKQRFGGGFGGSFGFGGDGSTNLHLLTHIRGSSLSPAGTSLGRLRVFDEAGNEYDACWGAHTGSFPGHLYHGWQIRAFPRRAPELGLRFLTVNPDGAWTNAVEFKIPNPAFAKHPQWKPEPWPLAKEDGDLVVTLKEFVSGVRLKSPRNQGTDQAAAKATRVVLGFQQPGRETDNWRLQKLTLSDATGNRWSPYLDLEKPGFNWATNGTAEFLGALWPGEDAWRLKAELVRTGGFAEDETWSVTLPLPVAGSVASLTNTWKHEGLGAALIGFGSPEAEHTGDFRWVAKWWGDDKDTVYSLAIGLDDDLDGRRFTVVRVEDADGKPVKLVQHQNTDRRQQAVFIKPEPSAKEATFTFAIQRSRFVEFLARPAFVK